MTDFVLGDYIFSRKRIGKGAFSTIYKGTHKFNGKTYAIKEICFDNLEKIRENIRREFTLMKALNHPNIIKLHDVFFDNFNKNVYLVLDYYEKGDFSKFLKKKPLKEMYAKKYMRQLISGLKYLYENKILHRDLKLQNILVTNDLNIVITDFGFARYFENDTILQTICGSPLYMAPEIIMKKKYTPKSDLWSLGVIFFELLTGKPPFYAKNMIELIQKIKKDPVKLPTEFENVLTTECKELLFSLLQKSPTKRIEWEDLFDNKWFKTDEILDNENKLFEITMTGSKLPNLDDYDLNKSEFLGENLFKHKSIKDSYSSNNNSNKDSTKDSKDSNRDSDELQFKMSMEENTDYNDPLVSSTDSFKSLNKKDKVKKRDANNITSKFRNKTKVTNRNKNIGANIDSDIESDMDMDTEMDTEMELDKAIPRSEPIPIYNSPSINDTMFYKNKGYEIIQSIDYRYMSEPLRGFPNNSPASYDSSSSRSLSESIKNYVSNFLRQSYNYISSNKTI